MLVAAAPLGLALLTRRNRWVVLGLVAASFACLGAARYQAHHEAVVAKDELVSMRESGRAGIRGTVISQPEVVDVTTRWRLEVSEVRQAGSTEWDPAEGRVLVYHRWLVDVRYGDELELQGKVETPPQFDHFDYRAYLARQGVHNIMRYPRFTVLGHDHGNPFLGAVYEVRARLGTALEAILPEPQAAIASGILLGIRSAIPEEITEAFRRTGTTHILAVSGHNLTVVAGLVAVLSGRLLGRRHWSFFVLSLLAIWAYALLAGFVPSVVRAAIMASLVFTARATGRQDYALPGLAFAAAGMVAVDPLVLWDLGFQLSVLAMWGILWLPPLLEQAGARFRPGPAPAILRVVGPGAAATLGAALFTLPVLAVDFRLVPLAALPASLLAIPALGFILVGALITAILGLVSPVVAMLPGLITWAAASYLLWIVDSSTRIPFASVELPAVDPLAGWAYLGLLLALVWLASRWAATWPARRNEPPVSWSNLLPPSRRAPALGLVLLGALTLGGTWAAASRLSPDTILVRFLDVGQGDAVLVETGSGHRMLVDGGPSPSKLLGHLGRWIPPWENGLDLIVLTHPERDHITGLLAALDRYRVDLALESEREADTMEYRAWERTLQERGTQRLRVSAGARLRIGDADIEVLHPRSPPEQGSGWQPNDASLVLRLAAHGHSVLLTGDVEAHGEAALTRATERLPSSVLKVPHHGAKNSTSGPLLSAVSPQAAVISVGAGNSFGHPAQAVLDRLAGVPVLRTDLDGTVELRITRSGAVLRGERPRPEPQGETNAKN